MIDVVVKVTALLGVAWMMAAMLRGRAASTRHAVWIGLMAAALALPVLAALGPRIELAWLPADPPGITQPPQASGRTFDVVPQGRGESSEPDAFVAAAATPPAQSRTAPTLQQTLLGGWLIVAILLVGRLVSAHVQARRALARCSEPSLLLANAAATAARELGMSAPPLRVAQPGTMPAVMGVLRPAIVLPLDAASWTPERLRVVLLHECAHVRRRDAILQIVANVAAAAYWWHPLAWVAARRVARERELACDDLVIAAGTTGAQYAEHLLEIARSLRPSRQPALAALAMARPSELEGRLIALLEDRPRPARSARALALGVALALVAVSIAPLKIVAQDAAIAALPMPEPIAQPASLDVPAVQTGTALMIDAPVASVAEPRGEVEAFAQSPSETAQPASPALAQALVRALADESDDIRMLALAQLIRLEHPETAAHVIAALRDESADVRRMAVMGLSRLDHPDQAALLLKAAADPSEDVRTMAALGLGRVSGAAVDEMLVKLSSDVSADVRRAAIIAISQRTGRDLDLATQFGAGMAESIASGIAQGVAGGIAGALDARLGHSRKR